MRLDDARANVTGRNVIKRGVALALILVVVLAAVTQLDLARAAQSSQNGQPQGQMSGTDCSYLKEPRNFDGVDGRHRVDLSRLTDEVTGQLEMTAQGLVAPQDIPRQNFIDNHIFDRIAQAGIASAPL